MGWVLIMYSNGKYYDQRDVEMVLTNNMDVCKKFRLVEYDNIDDYERCILRMLNSHLALRDLLYLVCDVNAGSYNYICKNMLKLRDRIGDVYDFSSLEEKCCEEKVL